MQNGRVEIQGNIIVISRYKTNKRQFILSLFAFLFSLIYPAYYSYTEWQLNAALSFRMVALILVGATVVFYTFQNLLWQLYGKEVMVFEEQGIRYYSDFKLFKGKEQFLKVKNNAPTFGVRINIADQMHERASHSTQEDLTQLMQEASFDEDNEVIETTLTISRADLKSIETKFFEIYGHHA